MLEQSERSAHWYNSFHKEIKFNPDDLIILWTPISSYEIEQTGKTRKLLCRWRGPYKVIRQTSAVNYLIENFFDKNQQIVHVQRMRIYKPWLEDISKFGYRTRNNLLQAIDEVSEIEIPPNSNVADLSIPKAVDPSEKEFFLHSKHEQELNLDDVLGKDTYIIKKPLKIAFMIAFCFSESFHK
jgi:hypothetical protein